ncbi:hypothetical protein KKC08_00285 [Patescibacteria group bacterium]|nr:hypothetical protein [Patescibacteria group bacterium]MCG2701672.1 hypothetical protein [Candidatus Parcubacteria bacterium]MBU4265393.1 hypothetical protein [Patescibacteria group bacterium]MBU4390345.1 hypothetical protein [Patescibacteria group bacterium]MBU4396592.1 hypothetical protein [Patescibacteria group bacterium]
MSGKTIDRLGLNQSSIREQAKKASKLTDFNQVGPLRPRRGHRGPSEFARSKRKSGFGKGR